MGKSQSRSGQTRPGCFRPKIKASLEDVEVTKRLVMWQVDAGD